MLRRERCFRSAKRTGERAPLRHSADPERTLTLAPAPGSFLARGRRIKPAADERAKKRVQRTPKIRADRVGRAGRERVAAYARFNRQRKMSMLPTAEVARAVRSARSQPIEKQLPRSVLRSGLVRLRRPDLEVPTRD